MNKREYRNGLICAIIGSVLTMIGDFFIGANPSVDVPTGAAMIKSSAMELKAQKLHIREIVIEN